MDGTKQTQKTEFIGQRNGPHKDQPKLLGRNTRPRSQTRNHERPMAPKIKRRQFTGPTDVIHENFSSYKERIPQQGTSFQHEAGRQRKA